MKRHFLLMAAALFLTICAVESSQAEGTAMAEKSGLSAVRLIGPRSTLDKMAAAAARVRWTANHFDEKGRLVLPVPPNYTPEDFGRLLEAIDPHTARLKGLQMLGPNGGPVDDKGIEHPDD